MTAQPVEAILVYFYGVEAHRATYGRHVRGAQYTKDYLQLSRKPEFLAELPRLFPGLQNRDESPLSYAWPGGRADGAIVRRSADRPHLKWETKDHGAPLPWRMTPSPTAQTVPTIPGDPTRREFADAEAQRDEVVRRGAGQPYLVAVRLRGEPDMLHLRAYLDGADADYAWADLSLLPALVQDMARSTSRRPALAWHVSDASGVAATGDIAAAVERLAAGETPEAIFDRLDSGRLRSAAAYLRSPGEGLFFDPQMSHDAWVQFGPLPEVVSRSAAAISALLDEMADTAPDDDLLAERHMSDAIEEREFAEQIDKGDYSVDDRRSSIKIRGSAQKAFARAVKANYGNTCAITGISTPDFLVAAHIVPWSEDSTIRLDPSNGICLSLMVDRAYELGYLLIEDDLTVRVQNAPDDVLREALVQYDGMRLREPTSAPPRPEYLRRRRERMSDTSHRRGPDVGGVGTSHVLG